MDEDGASVDDGPECMGFASAGGGGGGEAEDTGSAAGAAGGRGEAGGATGCKPRGSSPEVSFVSAS